MMMNDVEMIIFSETGWKTEFGHFPNFQTDPYRFWSDMLGCYGIPPLPPKKIRYSPFCVGYVRV